MKYKIGDKVKIRSDLELREEYDDYVVNEDMIKLKGKVVTILDCFNNLNTYNIDEGLNDWSWTDEMIE